MACEMCPYSLNKISSWEILTHDHEFGNDSDPSHYPVFPWRTECSLYCFLICFWLSDVQVALLFPSPSLLCIGMARLAMTLS